MIGGGPGGAVGRVYADALFAIAKQTNAVDEMLVDLEGVEAALHDNANFATLYSSPKLTREEASQMLRGTFEGKVGKHVLNLLLVLLTRGRQRALPQIADAFRAHVDFDRRQRRVAIATAGPLDAAQADAIAKAIAAKTGDRVILETSVDPSLLGGAVARVGDMVIDGSLRTGLARLAKTMQSEAELKTAH
ncbi:MAG: ATP synthase F1 subunit delta [bacterium]